MLNPIIQEFLDSFEDLTCYTLGVAPNTKPRMTARDCNRPNHKKYWAYKENIQWEAIQAKLNDLPGMISFIIFYVKIPSNVPKSKRAALENIPVPKTPDIDNFLKAFQDCLAKEDKHVHTIGVTKRYSIIPRIEVYVNKGMNEEMSKLYDELYKETKLFK